MYTRIADFEKAWKSHSESTQKIFDALSDASLMQSVADGHRTLGRMAWHIVTTIPEMMNQVGFKVESVNKEDPIPADAEQIKVKYRVVAKEFIDQVTANWTDEDLKKEDDLYGEKWVRGLTLSILIHHEIHHRGQMTVLMRQAGLQVPGIYGPALEEWSNYGMEAPTV